MAACTTTYFEAGRGWSARVTEHNAELLAKQAQLRRRMRTRLVKAPDLARVREMRIFSGAIAVLFSLVMIYGLQHFYAIENSYRVESEKQTLNQLREENRQLRLSQAELTQPGRIDMMARQLGLAAPQPGQVVHASGNADASTPVLAQMTPPSAPPAQ